MTTKYFLHAAAILSSAIVAFGYAGSASADVAQATGEDTMARCQQLSSLYSRHNTNGYARPLEVDLSQLQRDQLPEVLRPELGECVEQLGQ